MSSCAPNERLRSAARRYAEGGRTTETRPMRTYTFRVVVEPGEGGYHACCPALRTLGTVTQGATKEEALRDIHEVVQMIMDEIQEDGLSIPLAPSGDVSVFDDARVAVTV